MDRQLTAATGVWKEPVAVKESGKVYLYPKLLPLLTLFVWSRVRGYSNTTLNETKKRPVTDFIILPLPHVMLQLEGAAVNKESGNLLKCGFLKKSFIMNVPLWVEQLLITLVYSYRTLNFCLLAHCLFDLEFGNITIPLLNDRKEGEPIQFLNLPLPPLGTVSGLLISEYRNVEEL